ncbi:hypothetical protein K432DRAFT_185835 [Lepidopterella palustris CBS 459.81]|uniref:HTH CENPB-type domain-containing protein n=1 Tax=Lepidopterella palustris CBS 459.81 TaxID=1314670 RepID=A0A8E2DZZ4_9PEZI|nr:hypothetical protein K432DRAFT_185835 [Lepidopterella palustris CBS 459.81]
MAPPTTIQLPYNKGHLLLAISSINSTQIPSARCAASLYHVPEATVRSRRAGTRARRNCEPNSRKLTALEEEVIVRYILGLDARRFAPTLSTVRNMADKLFA